MITIKPTGNTVKILMDLKKMPKGTNQAIRMAAYNSGKLLTKYLTSQMTKKGRSGRTYLIYRGLGGRLLKNPRLHTASTEQEFPAVITGYFRKSVDFKVEGSRRMIFGSGGGGLATKYAGFLEKTRRPVERTVESNLQGVKGIFTNHLTKALKIK